MKIKDEVLFFPRKVLAEEMLYSGSENRKIVAVSCDSANGGFVPFSKEFPERFVECGIAEQNAVGVSAGLAKMGYIPFIMAITPFITMRNYEQVRDDIGYSNMNIKIIGTGAGLAYSTLGYTHEALEDVALMNTIPNMTIFSPGDSYEVRESVKLACSINGPVYIRMPIHPQCNNAKKEERNYHIGNVEILTEGEDAVLITYGSSVNQALIAEMNLREAGINITVAEANTIRPIDEKAILEFAQKYPVIFTVEEHSLFGGIGTVIARILATIKFHAPLHSFGVPENSIIITGPYNDVLDYYEISGSCIAKNIIDVLNVSDIPVA